MGRAVDNELVEKFEEEAENAYMSIVMQHPEEDFYLFMFHFDENLHARISAFSKQALERAYEEQGITDEQEKRWYRLGGVAALCAAYGYTERLSELDDELDRRAAGMIGDPWEMLQILAGSRGKLDIMDPDVDMVLKCEKEFKIRVDSAAEAVHRLHEKGLFGEHSRRITSRVGSGSLNNVLKQIYMKNRDDAEFLVMMLCDSDSRSPLMPEWFTDL